MSRRHRFCALLGILIGHQEEAGGAAGRVDDCVVDCRLDDVDDRLDECARCEVLAGAGSLVRGALAEQFLVGIALDVGPGLRPVLLVDEVDDEPLELGRVLNAVLCLAENRADHPRLAREPVEDPRVLQLELVALGVEQLLPGVLFRHDLLRLQFPRGPLVCHLEEQQIGQLLRVLDDPDSVIAQDVAVGPQLVDEPPSVSHSRNPHKLSK